jgi:hypothetical protein
VSCYLTIVVAGSNEDYGGNFIERMQTCLDSIFTGAARYGLDADLLLVDWGTPPGRKCLFDSIGWSKCRIPVRVVNVPKEFIAKIPNPHGVKFLEPWAKSVGVRRATGEFILTINADGIYSDPLMACLSRMKFDHGCVYRVNRYDKDAQGRVYQVHRANGTFAPGEDYMGISKTPAHWTNNMAHYNAAGEFMLMSKDAYHAIRGWPEQPYWAHVDSMVLYLALKHGLRQVVLEEPLYHQDHYRNPYTHTPKWSDAEPWAPQNGEGWGFANENFETWEIQIKGR